MKGTMRKRIVSGIVALGLIFSPAGAGLGAMPAFAEDGAVSVAADNGDNGSEGGETTPEGGETTPDGGETTPDGGETTPDGGETTPDGGETTPDGGETTPDGGETDPEGDETTPEGDETTPEDGETDSEESENDSEESENEIFHYIEEVIGEDVLPMEYYMQMISDEEADAETDINVCNLPFMYSDLSAYGSSSAYEGLDSYEKIMYKGIYNAAVTIDSSSSYNATYNSTFKDYYFTPIRIYSGSNVKDYLDSWQDAWSACMDDNPQFFWMGHACYITYSSSAINLAFGLDMDFSSDYAKGTTRMAAKTSAMAEIERVLGLAKCYANEYSKEWFINEYLCEKVTYDLTAPHAHDITGILNGDAAVCESYAKCFQLFMNALDIDVLYVTGLGNGGNHAWNQVGLDNNGVTEWYNIDVTWNDNDKVPYYWNYFNVVDSDGSVYDFTNGYSGYNKHIPEITVHTCTSTTYSYANHAKNFAMGNADFAVTGNGISELAYSIEDALSIIVKKNNSRADYTITYMGEEDYVTIDSPVTVSNANSVTFAGDTILWFKGGFTANCDVKFISCAILSGNVKADIKTLTVGGEGDDEYSYVDFDEKSVVSIKNLNVVHGGVIDRGASSIKITTLKSVAPKCEDLNWIGFASANATVASVNTTGEFDIAVTSSAKVTITGAVTLASGDKINIVPAYIDKYYMYVATTTENGTTLITANSAAATCFKSSSNAATYAVYKEGKEVKVTLPRVIVTYGEEEAPISYASFANFDEAVTAVNADKNLAGKNVMFLLLDDVTSARLALPTKASKVLIKTYDIDSGVKKITLNNAASVSASVDLTLEDVCIESTSKTGYAFNATKNLTLSNFMSSSLTALKGNVKGELVLNSMFGGCSITGFGVMTVNAGFDAGSPITVNVGTLVINGRDGYDIYVSKDTTSFTVKDIKGVTKSGDAEIVYGAGTKPINITGNAYGSIVVSTYDPNGFTDGQKVFTARNADMSVFVLNEYNLPKDDFDYVLTRKVSDLCVGKAVFQVGMSDTVNNTEYPYVKLASWNDVVSVINAKNNGFEYTVNILDDVNVGGALTMPKAGSFSKLTLKAKRGEVLAFTGNITLTGATVFDNICLASVKKTKTGNTASTYSIVAGNYPLTIIDNAYDFPLISGIIDDVAKNAGVGNITSRSTVEIKGLSNVEGNISAAELVSGDGAWIGGNVTVSGKTYINKYGMGINGTFSTGELYAEDGAKLSVVKGKKITIGKGGFSEDSGKLELAIVNADHTPYTPKVLEVIATTSGSYAKNIVLSSECGGSKLTVVRSGNNLVAADSDKLIRMESGSKSYFYATYEDAIKDITAMADPDAFYVIYFSGETTIPRITMPAAKKYYGLSFAADEGETATIKTTSDINLTGRFSIWSGVTVNKVDTKGNIVDMNVNAGAYNFFCEGNVSYYNDTTHFGRLSSTKNGELDIIGNDSCDKQFAVSGAINADRMFFSGGIMTLGDRATVNVSEFQSGAWVSTTVCYPFKNAAKIKFGTIESSGELTFKSTDNTVITNGTVVANITGDLNTFVRIGDMAAVWPDTDEDIEVPETRADGYQAVRSGTKLVVIDNIFSAVKMVRSSSVIYQEYYYDTFDSAIKDITRIGDGNSAYTIYLNGDIKANKLTFPTVNKYASLDLRTGNSKASVTITTTSDLVMTGDLYIPANITINKVNAKNETVAMNVNTGNYYLICNGYLSNVGGVNQIGNINGKGKVNFPHDVNITGNVNIGTFYMLSNVTLSDRSSFTSAKFFAGSGKFDYPAKSAARVKLGDIFKSGSVIFPMFGEGKQLAAVTGDFPDGSIIFGDDHDYDELYKAVRTGSKIIIRKLPDAVIMTDNDGVARAYSYPEDALTDITRINNASGNYVINLTEGRDYARLPLPVKGKYNSVKFVADATAYIDITSDITLTGNLIIGNNVTLRKVSSLTAANATVKPLKITAPANTKFKASTEGTGKILNASGAVA